MATQKRKASRPVAIELLESDHRKVEALFQQYESEKEGDEALKREIATKICGELSAHAQLEEELFYPWMRENLDEDDMEMLEEAYVEHAGAKDLIAQLEAANEIDATYDAKVKVLGEYIKHHVKEEEEEIFPAVSDEKDELDELGQEMHARKAEIAEELGLEPDAPPPDARGAKGSKSAEQRGSR
ncbi:MAG: hemerythrin domain-containing protein [Usitatibacter sp.]